MPVPADYTGDGRTDFAVFNPAAGTWTIKPAGHSPTDPGAPAFEVQWGQAGDIAVPGDYDRDGKADYIIWRPGEATWYVKPTFRSIFGPSQPFTVQWGQAGDRPFLGLRRGAPTSLGTWRPATSSRLDTTPGSTAYPRTTQSFPWPLGKGRLVTADFAPACSGTSVANYAAGTWRIQGRGFDTVVFGGGFDIPVPARYTGTKNDDIAVWNSLTGAWRILPEQTC